MPTLHGSGAVGEADTPDTQPGADGEAFLLELLCVRSLGN